MPLTLENCFTKKACILSFITALAVANVSGPQYVYPTFGTSLITRFHWNGIENSIVSTATFVGVSFSGPLCAWMIENLSFRRTLIISSFTAFAGLLLLAQTYAGHLSHNYILCSVYLACMGAAGAASYLCALDSQAHNFKSHRGMSMGFTSASLGISGLVFSQINDKFFKSQVENDEQDSSTYDYLIFIACCILCVTLFGSFVLGPIDTSEQVDIVQDLREQEEELAQNLNNHNYTQSISSFSTSSTRYEDDETEGAGEERPLLIKNVIISADNISMIKKINQAQEENIEQPYITGVAFFTDPVGFALSIALLVILGLGYVYLANLGQLIISVSPKDMKPNEAQHLRNVHVSIFSLANCASRALFGVLSDILLKRAGVHRLWFFWSAAVGLMMSLTYLVSIVSTADELISCTVMVAIVYGITFGIAPATISEFGTKAFARNWGWLLCAPAIGSQLFNVLFGTVYEAESKRQGSSGSCFGSACYQMTFLVGIFSAFICTLVLSLAIYKKGLHKQTTVFH
ncbi:major facilitator superfamily domain-containing protein [Gilbertella persicaria]|uniref:major facilitator superfamily domain-containing protein n=1 Tax=Gilbertella persicaria TaxID=101096 RepID=UPI0022210ACE|nr:major facilitator superfamily domain-containing protein [Gilbertella persicaria]KAI8097947.1 major facilitator superfamily domain-containing protein [Gilbertella persicaria]